MPRQRGDEPAALDFPFRQPRGFERYAKPLARRSDGEEAAIEARPVRHERLDAVGLEPVGPAHPLEVALNQHAALQILEGF